MYYLLCILVCRIPVFRVYFHEGVVSKDMWNVPSRWVGNRDECIGVNGVLSHPLFEIDNAQGQPLFVFSRFPFQSIECRLQIGIVALQTSDFGVMAGFVPQHLPARFANLTGGLKSTDLISQPPPSRRRKQTVDWSCRAEMGDFGIVIGFECLRTYPRSLQI